MVELIAKKHSFVGKNGATVLGFNYYLKTESGMYICIKPVFDDYQKLRVLAKVED